MRTDNPTEKSINRYKRADGIINWTVRIILLTLIIIIISILWDVYAPNDKTLPYHEEPWLMIDNTHIDYKVMQGKDNFEYLSKNPYGDYYVGGSLFLDYRNDKDYEDEYNIIYGHNMAGGKMFADLKLFYDKKFFDTHKTGTLFLKDKMYKLKIIGVLKCNAYVNGIYHVKTINDAWIEEYKKCVHKREDYKPGDKILAMSTCSTTMDDNRDVVFAKMLE